MTQGWELAQVEVKFQLLNDMASDWTWDQTYRGFFCYILLYWQLLLQLQ